MSRTYYPKNKKIEAVNFNVAGCQILSKLIEHFNLERANYEKSYLQDQYDPPFKAIKKRTTLMAQQLMNIEDIHILEFFLQSKLPFTGSPGQFLEWLRSWQKFLSECNGYET